jgi:hypothetical protein
MFSEISEGRRVKLPSEICWPGDLLPYTLRGITGTRKHALLLGQCSYCGGGGGIYNRSRLIIIYFIELQTLMGRCWGG